MAEVDNGVGGGKGGGRGRSGWIRWQRGGEGGEVGAIERVVVEVEDGFSGGGGGGGEEGFGEASAKDDEVEGSGVDGGVVVREGGGPLGHGENGGGRGLVRRTRFGL